MNLVDKYTKATLELAEATQEIDARLKKLNEIIMRTSDETQDLLHMIELDRFDAARGYELTRQLQNVRKRRRQAKDEKRILEKIRKTMNNNCKFDSHVYSLRRELRDLNKEIVERTYHPRIRTDMKKRFDEIKEKERKTRGNIPNATL